MYESVFTVLKFELGKMMVEDTHILKRELRCIASVVFTEKEGGMICGHHPINLLNLT